MPPRKRIKTEIEQNEDSLIVLDDIEDVILINSSASNNANNLEQSFEEILDLSRTDIIEAPSRLLLFPELSPYDIQNKTFSQITCVYPYELAKYDGNQFESVDDLFYLGRNQIQIYTKNNDYDPAKTQMFMYKLMTNFKSFGQEFAIYLIKNDYTEFELTEISCLNSFQHNLLYLFSEKCLKLIVTSFQFENDKSYILNFNIYLTSKLRNDELSEFPSSILSNKYSNFMNSIMYTLNYLKLPNVISNNLTANNETDKQDDFFKMVHDLNRQFYSATDSEIDLIQESSCLRPMLRPYQINAVKWMLDRENFDFSKINMDKPSKSANINSEHELHPLFIKIVNKDVKTIYLHKFFGLFTTMMPLKQQSLTGGILADEMGLGKTLEMLATIIINPLKVNCSELNQSLKMLLENSESKTVLYKDMFSCVCGQKPLNFSVLKSRQYQTEIYSCVLCNLWMHVKCTNYKNSRETFICLACHEKIPPLSSGCTLIITPSIISQQWSDEIEKHLGKTLKVFFYHGANHTIIQHPTELAKLDICITTYDILSSELSHIFSLSNTKVLRRPKRYMTVPSPLLYVKWWRVCLDEAQMVHSTNTKCAEMANRLNAVNRWCLTGTPIGKSLGDLHGLFSFIRQDPFLEKRWFDEILLKPFNSGDKASMVLETSKVLWRTSKKFVENQINLADVTEKLYWINFSPFELHLYERVREDFRKARSNSFRNMNELLNLPNKTKKNVSMSIFDYNPTIKLDELERQKLDYVLAPLYNMRITCNHPQLILKRTEFMEKSKENKEKLLTMEKSLELLMKKTKDEAEAIYRSIGNSLIGLASIKFYINEYWSAINFYQNLLEYEKNLEQHQIHLTNLQAINLYYNYIEALDRIDLLSQINIDDNFQTQQIKFLNTKLQEYERKQVINFDERKMKSENLVMIKLKENLIFATNNPDGPISDWLKVLQDDLILSDKQENVWRKLNAKYGSVRNDITDYFEEESQTNTNSQEQSDEEKDFEVSIEIKICGREIKNVYEIWDFIGQEFEKIIETRERVIDFLMIPFEMENKIQFEDGKFQHKNFWNSGITKKFVSHAAICHLKKEPSLKKCCLCALDHFLNVYSKHFCSNEKPQTTLADITNNNNVNPMMGSNNNIEEEENEITTDTFLYSQHSTSELEEILRILASCYLKKDKPLTKAASFLDDMIKFYGNLKVEKRLFFQYYSDVSNQVNNYNTIETAKLISTRLRFTYESDDINKKDLEDFVFPEKFEYSDFSSNNYENVMDKLWAKSSKFTKDRAENEVDLKKKLNQLIYLKNLQKTYKMVDGESNKDPCPICSEMLGYEWYILSCGHLYCKNCNLALLNIEVKNYSRCALCRELCLASESYLVSTILNSNNHGSNETLKRDIDDGNEDDLSEIKLIGSYNSAKIDAVVKCIVKILRDFKKPKCVIFSEHLIVLELIKNSLDLNSIQNRFIKNSQTFDKFISDFKFSPNISVLLMPYYFGANGLNLIEASHVLLVEPTLNKSREAQAIGRIHRIGQTKDAYVHRFIVRNTVEETVFNLFRDSSKIESIEATNSTNEISSQSEVNSNRILTIGDMISLFLAL